MPPAAGRPLLPAPLAVLHPAAVLCALLLPRGAGGAGSEDGWTRPGAPMDVLYDLFFNEIYTGEPVITLTNRHGSTGAGSGTNCYKCTQEWQDPWRMPEPGCDSCTGSNKDQTASLYLIDGEVAVTAFLNDPPEGGWTMVMDTSEELVLPSLVKLAASPRFSAAVVRKRGPAAVRAAAAKGGGAFSGGAQQPNLEVDVYNRTANTPVWNPEGTNAAFASFRGAVVVLEDSEFDEAANWARVNRDKGYSEPLRMGQYYYPMDGNGLDANHCLWWQHCYPLGSQSLWGSLRSMDTYDNTSEYVMIAVPITATSLFTRRGRDPLAPSTDPDMALLHAPGASVVAGTASAAVAAIELLAKARDRMAGGWQVVFGFFAGEEYGAMGSMRFVDDANRLRCSAYPQSWVSSNTLRRYYYCYNPPYVDGVLRYVNLDQFKYVIALDQIGVTEIESQPAAPAGNPSGLWVHYDDPKYRDAADDPTDAPDPATPTANTIRLRDLFSNTPGVEGASADFEGRLPPSPAQSFLAHELVRNRTDFGAVVLAGYPGPFVNRFWGSVYDTSDMQEASPRLSPTLVASAATAVADAVWDIVGDGDPLATPAAYGDDFNTHVKELVTCLGEDQSCDLILKYYPNQDRKTLLDSCPSPCGYSKWVRDIGSVWDRKLSHVKWLHDHLIKVLDDTPQDKLVPCAMSSISGTSTCPSMHSSPYHRYNRTETVGVGINGIGDGLWDGGIGLTSSYCVSKGEASAVDPPVIGIDSTGLNGNCMNAAVYYMNTWSPDLANTRGNSSGRFYVRPNSTRPVWARSQWTRMGSSSEILGWGEKWTARLFTKDSRLHDAALLISGIVTTGLSFGAMVLFNKVVLPKLKRD